jgi:dTMP kinase
LFVTLEGPDGAGKTTQAALLVERLRGEGQEVIAVREPGGTDLGMVIREVLVRRNWTPIDPRAEALLFAACRAQLVVEVIEPALARGAVIVADRFADSTRAYQGAGRGLPAAELEALIAMATRGIAPDLTFLLDVPVFVGRSRQEPPPSIAPASLPTVEPGTTSVEGWNRFEDEAAAFHERVRQAYLALSNRDPKRWVVVDASQPVDRVHAELWRALSNRLNPAPRSP